MNCVVPRTNKLNRFFFSQMMMTFSTVFYNCVHMCVCEVSLSGITYRDVGKRYFDAHVNEIFCAVIFQNITFSQECCVNAVFPDTLKYDLLFTLLTTLYILIFKCWWFR